MTPLQKRLLDAQAPLPGHRVVFGKERPMPLDCGVDFGPFTIAYQTYGRLNAARSNAIMVCHALTGDQFLIGEHPVTGRPGWWDQMVGPGKPLDTERYFIICSNVLGGCMGTTGPRDTNPATGRPFGLGFPVIMADPDWCGGDYLLQGRNPARGLAVARMAAHITYLSEQALHRKFGRTLQDRKQVTYGFDADFQVESYLRHQGSSFVERFDANSYLYITRAMDYFDLAAEKGGVLANAFRGTPVRFCLFSFTSDWLFPTRESRAVVQALNAAAANVSFVEIESDKGHDAFLLDEPEFEATLRGFLAGSAERRGIA